MHARTRTWEVLPEASGVWKLVVSLPKGRLAMNGEMFTASTRLQQHRGHAAKRHSHQGQGGQLAEATGGAGIATEILN